MSARDELHKFVEEEALGPIPLLRETMDALIDAYAHELAEKIRKAAQDDVDDHVVTESSEAMFFSANLIDPEVE